MHWDLMLEAGGALRTYRLELPPEKLTGQKCTATRIHDHPLRFLTYQGSVNKGLGSVRIADSGTYSIIEESAQLRRLDFNGEILKGVFTLVCTEGDALEFAPYRSDANRQG